MSPTFTANQQCILVFIEAENVEAHHAFDDALFPPRADYLLRIVGLSVRDAGILDGDLITVRKTEHAEHGRTVIARIDDDVTVRRRSSQRPRAPVAGQSGFRADRGRPRTPHIRHRRPRRAGVDQVRFSFKEGLGLIRPASSPAARPPSTRQG
jgi:hypothetical protein